MSRFEIPDFGSDRTITNDISDLQETVDELSVLLAELRAKVGFLIFAVAFLAPFSVLGFILAAVAS